MSKLVNKENKISWRQRAGYWKLKHSQSLFLHIHAILFENLLLYSLRKGIQIMRFFKSVI